MLKTDSWSGTVGFKVEMLHFVRLLRRIGLTVGSNQILTWMEALQMVDWKDSEIFYYASESALLNRGVDRALFRRAFMAFWQGRNPRLKQAGTKDRGALNRTGSSEQGLPGRLIGAGPIEPIPAADVTNRALSAYSPREVLRSKDFAAMTDQEEQELQQFLTGFRFELASFQAHRYEPGGGNRLDFRSSVRRNMRIGGEWLHWDRRRRKWDRPTLVVLADISGSMERYSRVLLRFIHGLSHGYQPGVEAFLFGTRLTRITPALKSRSAELFLERIGALVPDWSGGTQIGGSLEEFHLEWARRVLSRPAAVMVMSDGWDRGDSQKLAQAMARLQRSSTTVIWLNPLLGSLDYRPETRGMKAALPFIDYFLPAHNLESLVSLSRLLGRIKEGGQRLGIRQGNPGRLVAA